MPRGDIGDLIQYFPLDANIARSVPLILHVTSNNELMKGSSPICLKGGCIRKHDLDKKESEGVTTHELKQYSLVEVFARAAEHFLQFYAGLEFQRFSKHS